MQKWPRNKTKVGKKKKQKSTLNTFFLENPPGFWTFETSSWILTSNQLFWPEPIYWDINFVLKCLTAHCEAHRPPIENQCFHQVQWLTLQKPLPFHIGQNGCLPSFYAIFTSTHDDLVEMTRHGRWIITNAMVGYNWKPMLSSSPMVDSSKAIAIPHWPRWLLTNGNWLGRVARKKLPF